MAEVLSQTTQLLKPRWNYRHRNVSPITVTGLTNGTPYTFTVTATNDVGTSSPSVSSNSITPMTVPSAPIISTTTAGNAEATITFTAPVSDGGSSITGYTVTSNPGALLLERVETSPITVSGLTNGTAYTFVVTATNSVGVGTSSTPSSPAVTPATVPDPPTGRYADSRCGTSFAILDGTDDQWWIDCHRLCNSI